MTAQEAIRRIKDHNNAHQRKEPFAVHITEALDEAVAALDKQVPKKPVLCGPVCGGQRLGHRLLRGVPSRKGANDES